MNLRFLLVPVLEESRSWTWRRKLPLSLKGVLSSFLARPTRKYLLPSPITATFLQWPWLEDGWGMGGGESGSQPYSEPECPRIPPSSLQLLSSSVLALLSVHVFLAFLFLWGCDEVLEGVCSRFSSHHNLGTEIAVGEYVFTKIPQLEHTTLVFPHCSFLGPFLN